MPLQRNDRDQGKTQGSSLSIPGVLPGCLTRKPQSWTRLSRTDIPSCSQAETWNSIVLPLIQAKRWAGPAYRPHSQPPLITQLSTEVHTPPRAALPHLPSRPFYPQMCSEKAWESKSMVITRNGAKTSLSPRARLLFTQEEARTKKKP